MPLPKRRREWTKQYKEFNIYKPLIEKPYTQVIRGKLQQTTLIVHRGKVKEKKKTNQEVFLGLSIFIDYKLQNSRDLSVKKKYRKPPSSCMEVK